jgi:MOSC domain-containing protein YiiM
MNLMPSACSLIEAPDSPPVTPLAWSRTGRVVALCTSPGGIPKRPLAEVVVSAGGLAGDGRSHAKHIRPDRAVSLFDLEILQQLVREGFPLKPGTAGENLTVEGLDVQSLPPGTILEIGDVVLRLEAPRKPCYVLDAIDPRLKDVIVGRCGYLASVLRGGTLHIGAAICCVQLGVNSPA